MEAHFSSDFIIGNRQRLRTLFKGTAPIVITANGTLQRNGDSNYHFRQDSSFWYLTGLQIPDAILVMDKFREYIILPKREHINEVFNGDYNDEAISKQSGIKEVFKHKDGWRLLNKRLKRTRHIATLAAPPSYHSSYEFHTNPARSILIAKLKAANPAAEILDLRVHLMKMRLIKQAPELEAINRAITITIATIKDTLKHIKMLPTEHDIEAYIEYGFKKRGADGHSFDPVVATGSNTCTVHHRISYDLIVKNNLLLLDVGAEFQLYAADISRTYVIGKPSKRQQAVHAAVLDVWEFGRRQLKPNISIKDCEKNIEHFMGEKLRSLGLIKTIDKDNVRKYYPHAASHFMGLDVHDAGDYEQPLEAGNVLTLEPGIYIPEEGIGIRIEDDLLITDKGARVLSAALPHALA